MTTATHEKKTKKKRPHLGTVRVGQERIATGQPDSPRTEERWIYGFIELVGSAWRPASERGQYEEIAAECTINRPTIMWGTEEEIHRDISDLLFRKFPDYPQV